MRCILFNVLELRRMHCACHTRRRYLIGIIHQLEKWMLNAGSLTVEMELKWYAFCSADNNVLTYRTSEEKTKWSGTRNAS